MAYPTPGPDEIKNALGKQHSDAIPYRDLRDKAKQEYAKQKSLPAKFEFGSLKTVGEVMVALDKVRVYRDQRATVMAVFKNAMARLDTTIKALKPNDPRKTQLDSILKVLKAEKDGHEAAIEQGNSSIVKGKKILEALQKKEREEEAAKKLKK
jgi:hypothetical protein